VTNPAFARIVELVNRGEFLLSAHAYEKAAKEDIVLSDLVATLSEAEVIEDYPNAWKGPSILLRHEVGGEPIHAVWGLPKGAAEPAVLITCYRPDATKWDKDFRTRK
jgi:hypothetical protein